MLWQLFLCFSSREKEVRVEIYQSQADVKVNGWTSSQLVVKETLGGQIET